MLIIWLLLGVLWAIGFVAIARRSDSDRVYALGLLVAALIYVGFAFGGNASGDWCWIEFLGVGIYGLCALLGLMFSPWWLMLGWLFHPIWDVYLHLLDFIGNSVAIGIGRSAPLFFAFKPSRRLLTV